MNTPKQRPTASTPEPRAFATQQALDAAMGPKRLVSVDRMVKR